MTFPAYPEYKDSGVEWLSEMPVHWQCFRLKYLFEQKRRPINEDDSIITCFRDGQVTLRANRRTEGFTNALQEVGYQGVKKGDLVIHAMDAFAGAIGVSDSNGKSSPVYSVCEPRLKTTSPKYYGFLLRSMALSGFVASMAKGIRERSTDFRWSDAANVLVPVPPDDEQQMISIFIDHETARTDALIEEQQRLIELLKEKRQAAISHAVTKGPDPDVPMKDSGVEWLGEVPAHWTVKSLALCFRAQKGTHGAQLTSSYCSERAGEFPVYSGQTENDGILGHIDWFEFDKGEDGAILTTTVGARAMAVSHVRGRFSLSQNCMIITSMARSIDNRFFYYHFQPLFSFERRLIPDHMQASFRMEDLYSLRIAQPPLNEQRGAVQLKG